MKTRTDLLNTLIKRFRLMYYLELGTQSREQNFNKLEGGFWGICVDIDPKAQAHFTMSTDNFFEAYKASMFDLIFIDASHEFQQVKKDFINSVEVCTHFIVLHDCNPEREEHTVVPRPTKTGHWNGDVFKLACNIPNDCKYTVDIDNGCCVVNVQILKGMIKRKEFDFERLDKDLPWTTFAENRRELLNLIAWDDFTKI